MIHVTIKKFEMEPSSIWHLSGAASGYPKAVEINVDCFKGQEKLIHIGLAHEFAHVRLGHMGIAFEYQRDPVPFEIEAWEDALIRMNREDIDYDVVKCCLRTYAPWGDPRIEEFLKDVESLHRPEVKKIEKEESICYIEYTPKAHPGRGLRRSWQTMKSKLGL